MINFEKQFESIESKFKDIESNLNNQLGFDTEKLVKLNKEYAELTPIVETIKKYKEDKSEIIELSKLVEDDDVSIKEMAFIELKEKREKLLANISEGSTLNGKVKNITDYGAFIDLGGIDGLVHVTDISWKKINHPSDELEIGLDVKVKVLKYDEEITRLSLGIKQLSADPWEEIDNKFTVNETYNVKVTNITDHGVTVEMSDNFEGFVQSIDLSWLKKPPHPSKIVQIDQKINVKLLEINKEKRRLNCGLKQLRENPWENIKKNYNVGDSLETEIVNKVDFGFFVKIFEEIDGMVHISDLSWNEKENEKILKSLKKGENIKVKILEIDTAKERVSLSVKHLQDDPIQNFISKNPIKSIVSGKIIEIDERGLTIELANNINGFIKKTNLSKNKTDQKVDRFADGESVDSMIIAYDSKLRRINLSIKDKEREEEEKDLSKYGSSDSGASLGDILGNALNKKKSE